MHFLRGVCPQIFWTNAKDFAPPCINSTNPARVPYMQPTRPRLASTQPPPLCIYASGEQCDQDGHPRERGPGSSSRIGQKKCGYPSKNRGINSVSDLREFSRQGFECQNIVRFFRADLTSAFAADGKRRPHTLYKRKIPTVRQGFSGVGGRDNRGYSSVSSRSSGTSSMLSRRAEISFTARLI